MSLPATPVAVIPPNREPEGGEKVVRRRRGEESREEG